MKQQEHTALLADHIMVAYITVFSVVACTFFDNINLNIIDNTETEADTSKCSLWEDMKQESSVVFAYVYSCLGNRIQQSKWREERNGVEWRETDMAFP